MTEIPNSHGLEQVSPRLQRHKKRANLGFYAYYNAPIKGYRWGVNLFNCGINGVNQVIYVVWRWRKYTYVFYPFHPSPYHD